MWKLCVSLALVALVALASASYHERCQYNGQFLPNDYDECSYFRCDYGDEPWYDEYGNIKFVEVPMKCAYGTSTHPYKFDPYSPCGETSDKCGAPAYYRSYQPHPKPHASYEPHQPHVPPHVPHKPHQQYPGH